MQQAKQISQNLKLPCVVIFTALPIEFKAVVAHLEKTCEVTHPKGTVYECGEFYSPGQSWEVAVVETGPGNISAALEVQCAIDYFDPKIILFVGIAGGIKDVSIGDVIAGTKVYGYESGKIESEFKPRPILFKAAYILEQRARAICRKDEWQKRMRNYNPTSLPKAFVGPIAAGEKLFANTEAYFFQFIKNNYGDALGVEMEGYGFHEAAHHSGTDAIVIRGISDLIDGKSKSDATGSQEKASHNASAFAFELLSKFIIDATPITPLIIQSEEQSPDLSIKKTQPEPEKISLERILSAFKNASTKLLTWPTTLGNDKWLDRREIKLLLSLFETQENTTTLLLGGPGSGKSALLAKLGNLITSKGFPVLAIKADTLDVSIDTFEKLAESLNLPVNNPIVCIEEIASTSKLLVIIDQLDALGDLVDLKSQRLNVLLNLIKAISDLPNVFVLASCRSFEYNHDARLRSIKAEILPLEQPAWESIASILKEKNIQATEWSESFRQLLMTPLHLRTFLEISSSSTEKRIFYSYQSMLDVLWKIKVLNEGGIQGRSELLEKIAAKMGEQETLWLPHVLFEDQLKQIESLEAAGILLHSNDERAIGFYHQTLFDYARARAFAKGVESLSDYVLARQDALFVRSQLWSSLHYLRGSGLSSYKSEFERLWKENSLRLHIRILLMEFLGQLSNPEDYETAWLLPCLEQREFRQRILSFMAGSPGWFERLVCTYLPLVMVEKPEHAWEAVVVLQRAWSFAKDSVIKLLRQHWLTDNAKDFLTYQTLRELAEWNNDTVDIACTIFKRTGFDLSAIGHIASIISVSTPNLAPRVIRAELDRRLTALQYYSYTEYEQLLKSLAQWYDLPAIAEASPEAYLEDLWPWFVDILSHVANEPNQMVDRYRSDCIYMVRLKKDDDEDDDRYPFVSSFEDAIVSIASKDSNTFLSFLKKWEESDLLIVQRLLARGLQKLIASHTKVVLDFLFKDARRLTLGTIYDEHFDTKHLISALVPHLSSKEVQNLENVIKHWNYSINQSNDDTRTKFDRIKYNRKHRLLLMRAIPREFMSTDMRRFFDEEERAFPSMPDKQIHSTGLQEITSPMSAEQMAKAKDEDILKLFNVLVDNTKDTHPRDFMRGGSLQASRAFSEFAQLHSQRAVSLLSNFKPGLQETPVGMALEGLSKANYPKNELFDLILQLDSKGFQSLEFHTDVARALNAKVEEGVGLPDSMCNLLERWLASSVEETEQDQEESESREDKETVGSILWGDRGFYVVPQGSYTILETLTKAFLLKRPVASDRWLTVLETHLLRNDKANVWHKMVRYFRYLSNCDCSRATNFLSDMFNKYPAVRDSREGAILTANVQSWIPHDYFYNWITSLRDTKWKDGPQAYAEILLLHHAWYPDEEWASNEVDKILLNNQVYKDVIAMRLGFAYSVSHLWSESKYRKMSTSVISKLISEENEEIQKAIADIFRIVDTLLPDDYTRTLLDLLCEHPNVLQKAHNIFIVERLQDLLPLEPDRVYSICKTMLQHNGSDLSNISTSFSAAAPEMINIALTLQRLGGDYRKYGLELFEKLLELNAYGAKDTLMELDHRPGHITHHPIRRKRKTRKEKSK